MVEPGSMQVIERFTEQEPVFTQVKAGSWNRFTDFLTGCRLNSVTSETGTRQKAVRKRSLHISK